MDEKMVRFDLLFIGKNVTVHPDPADSFQKGSGQCMTRTHMQSVESKKKKIPSSSEPKTSHYVAENEEEDPLAVDFEIRSLGNVDLDQLMKDQKGDDAESTLVGTTIIDQEIKEVESDVEFMPDDEILSFFGDDNKEDDSDNELYVANEVPDLLTATIKNTLPQALTKAVRETLSGFNRRIKNSIKGEIPKVLKTLVLKPMYKKFNALNKLET
uniref:Uncharacterized protein n=1 Tax=Tanacetum cinerariifolium TaxID=118510 RepID=A0A699INS2_TANCI|nr:hypothetical protein [Tanacetum cinerariifolium]